VGSKVDSSFLAVLAEERTQVAITELSTIGSAPLRIPHVLPGRSADGQHLATYAMLLGLFAIGVILTVAAYRPGRWSCAWPHPWERILLALRPRSGVFRPKRSNGPISASIG